MQVAEGCNVAFVEVCKFVLSCVCGMFLSYWRYLICFGSNVCKLDVYKKIEILHPEIQKK